MLCILGPESVSGLMLDGLTLYAVVHLQGGFTRAGVAGSCLIEPKSCTALFSLKESFSATKLKQTSSLQSELYVTGSTAYTQDSYFIYQF